MVRENLEKKTLNLNELDTLFRKLPERLRTYLTENDLCLGDLWIKQRGGKMLGNKGKVHAELEIGVRKLCRPPFCRPFNDRLYNIAMDYVDAALEILYWETSGDGS